MEKQAKKILVVDDEEDIRDTLAFSLKRQGYSLLLAASGNEALRIAELEKPDLVVSDVRMPNGDGVHLATQLRAKHHCDPPIIFVTGFADLTVEQAYAMGVEAIFSKPFDLQQLQTTIRAVLSNQEEKWGCRSTRVVVDVPVELKFDEHGQGRAGCVANIARGGMFVKMQADPSILGKTCAFQLECELADSKRKVMGEGYVKWVRAEGDSEIPAGCGIEFRAQDKNIGPLMAFVNYLKTKCMDSSF